MHNQNLVSRFFEAFGHIELSSFLRTEIVIGLQFLLLERGCGYPHAAPSEWKTPRIRAFQNQTCHAPKSERTTLNSEEMRAIPVDKQIQANSLILEGFVQIEYSSSLRTERSRIIFQGGMFQGIRLILWAALAEFASQMPTCNIM